MATLHDTDFYSWTQQQSTLLRSANFTALDVTNLIEEIEDMGGSQRRALESRLEVLLAHLLKWLFQPDHQSRSWEATIMGQRYQIKKLLRQNPGLKPLISEMLIDAYGAARLKAMGETGLALDIFPIQYPWTFDQTMDDDFWPQ